jgi:hypothetical protein
VRIVELRSGVAGGRARAAATVVWEDRDRPRQEIFFEVPAEFAGGLEPNPEAFLLAGVMPASDFGERRVSIDGAICPVLRNGLFAAFRVLRDWYPESAFPVIEPARGFQAAVPGAAPRVAALFSTGIDGLATLRCNRRDIPLDHPASIRDGFYFFGFTRHDYDASGPVPERVADFDRRQERVRALAEEARVTIIPVFSNLRTLAKDKDSWSRRGLGAGLAAIGHAFRRRVTRVLISSSGSAGSLPKPWGSHPLLDPHYSNAALEIVHDGLGMTRLEKTAIVAHWEAALAVLQCCWQEKLTADINCGRCSKCVRTMVQLEALGKLEGTRVFPTSFVTPAMIEAAPLEGLQLRGLRACADLLTRRNRRDLVAAIERRFEEERRVAAREQGWRKVARAFWRRVMKRR